MSRRAWKLRIADMIAAMEEIHRIMAGRDAQTAAADRVSYQAILYNLVVIGEAARAVPDDIRARCPDVDWVGITAMRNIVTHA